MSELTRLTAAALREKLRAGDVSALEVVEAALARIQAVDGQVRAFITVMEREAREQAAAVDKARARGEEPGPLAGLPVVLKDNLCTRGVNTSCGSKILNGWKPPYDATVVTRLREAGAVIVGKANMDEFAMGSSTENSGLFPTRNPWRLDRVPGGSSGGSTAAVAAEMAPLALGSDTGGSIRQPAAFCGIAGMKPTYGRVSRFGLVAYASSLDQIGPVARDVRDVALLLSVISGHDPCDSTSVDAPVPAYEASLTGEVKGLRIGLPEPFFAQGVETPVAAAVRAAADRLAGLGAEVETCAMPHAEHALPIYYIIAPAEASSNLARYDGVRYGHRSTRAQDVIGMFQATRDEGFGDEVKQRVMLGTYALSAGYYDAWYGQAQKARTLVRRDFDRAFERFDLLLTPTAPTVAFGIGEKSDDPLAMKLADVLTIPVNLAGLPAISVPCGLHVGLPIGMQLIGRPFDEATVLRAAHAYEQHTDWHTRRPCLLAI
jgi:aspartyl-tRNA(Asn)/glutamyl-tRNA(Gln) amidotransferase subunit A